MKQLDNNSTATVKDIIKKNLYYDAIDENQPFFFKRQV